MHALADGGLVYGATDPAFGRLDAAGRPRWQQGPEQADFRANYQDFLLSENGETVQFGLEYGGKNSVRFDLGSQILQQSPPVDSRSLQAPRTRADGLDIQGWENTVTPSLNGQPLTLKAYETSRSLAIAPDGQRFVLGTEWTLRCYQRDGAVCWPALPVPVAWGVNISGDGRKLAAALDDGTIRWYALDTGRELLALFPHRDGKRWVLWTPEGFFAHSPGAENLIGYHLNRGADQAGQFVSVDQLYDLFYRPDLVLARFRGEDDKLKNALAEIGDVRQVLAGGLPPAITLIDGAQVSSREGEYSLKLQLDDRGGGIGKVLIYVDGVQQAKIPARAVGLPRLPGQINRRLPLGAGRHSVRTLVYNEKGTVASRPKEQIVTVTAPKITRPALHLLAVGIDDYRDRTFHLNYAAADARSVTETLIRRGRDLFDKIYDTVLVDKQADRAGIEAALAEIAARARPEDVFVLYLAGHALTLDGNYHFLPRDFIYHNEQALREDALGQARLEARLRDIKARKSVLILDTCHSGALISSLPPLQLASRGIETKTAITRLRRATGRAILAAAGDTQMALEGYQGHGVFSFVLLQGLKGEADRQGNRNRRVSVTELAEYLGEEVPRITLMLWGYEQFPTRELSGRSFPLTVAPSH
ncbi:MAG: hypothetical protein GY832_17240 [Chloroflexi bacterium]|nr:hypothetical protein [Chloroflexota bacterium]